MPFISEKNHRRLINDAEQGRKAQAVFEHKAQAIVGLVAGGISKYVIEKADGVTDEQHQHYVEQIEILAATLNSMPLKNEAA